MESGYLQSKAWKNFCGHWFNSGLPRNCLGCRSTHDITLTHATYVRFGREWLNDAVPFCRTCLSKFLEIFSEADMTGLDNLAGKLADVFDVTYLEAQVRVAPFHKKREHLKPPKKGKPSNRRGSQYFGGKPRWKEEKSRRG